MVTHEQEKVNTATCTSEFPQAASKVVQTQAHGWSGTSDPLPSSSCMKLNHWAT
eukprot:m.252939 g.252939  ORF g.252939 m.252939 type:complete len:54 (-) comp15478_c1_seq1:3700-3861(-)